MALTAAQLTPGQQQLRLLTGRPWSPKPHPQLLMLLFSAAILANLLLGSSDESSDEAEYGAPAVDSYGAPAQEYAEPAPSYDAPAPAYEEPAPSYDAPAPAYDAPAPAYEEPVADTYGAPAADPLPSYGATNYYRF